MYCQRDCLASLVTYSMRVSLSGQNPRVKAKSKESFKHQTTYKWVEISFFSVLNSESANFATMGCFESWKPILAMLAVNLVLASTNIMIKKVIDEGLNTLVLITYRQLVATVFMAPIAFFTERKTRPKLTPEIFLYLFFSAMLGASLTQYLFFLGFQYTTATFSCAFLNVTPVVTFLIAIPFRLEKVNIKSAAGVAKVLGAIIGLTGAMTLSLYKGVALTNTTKHVTEHAVRVIVSSNKGKWMMGTAALIAGTLSWSSWFLLQSKAGKKYPALYSAATLIFFLSFIQAAVMCISTQSGLSIWVLKSKVEFITIIYSGLGGSGFSYLIMSWCVGKRGPVFTAAFCPLIQILVAAIDVSVLREQLHLGSVLGSVLVIAGLYFLLWGKSRDGKSNCAVKPSEYSEEIHGPVASV